MKDHLLSCPCPAPPAAVSRPRPRQIACSASPAREAEAPGPQAVQSRSGGRLSWHGEPASRVQATRQTPPVVILPGFGNCTDDYSASLGVSSNSLVACLQDRGFHSVVLNVKRADWLKALRGVFMRSYWQQKSSPQTCYGWYLARVQQAVNLARDQTGHSEVILLGHSAGGWLARAFMADPMFFETPPAEPDAPHQAVRHLVTLGTPHRAAELARDMTGGALTWVNRMYPGAHFLPKHGVQYTCVASRTVRGDRKAGARSLERYSFNSYSQVCGQGHDVLGDGVVPAESAFLQGANNVLLEGVYHSMSQIGSFSEPVKHVWYGSDSVVDHWLHPLVTPASNGTPAESRVGLPTSLPVAEADSNPILPASQQTGMGSIAPAPSKQTP